MLNSKSGGADAEPLSISGKLDGGIDTAEIVERERLALSLVSPKRLDDLHQCRTKVAKRAYAWRDSGQSEMKEELRRELISLHQYFPQRLIDP